MAFGGAALKLFTTFLYALCFCCAGIILAFYSYFLAVQADRDRSIPRAQKAVTGISGAGVLYTIFAVIFTCCLGGVRFFALLAILLDAAFTAGFIAIAIMTRDGATSCTGNRVKSPIGTGPQNSRDAYGQRGFGTGNGENVTYGASYGLACRMNKAAFAVSIIGAFLFAISAILQLWLGRHHQREKRFGPSPTNNYTSGSGPRWFSRKRGTPATTHAQYAKHAEAESGLASTGVAPDAYRPSHETAATAVPGDSTYTGTKYDAHQPTIPTTAGYHTGPAGTGVNPYGYDNRTHGTNF